MTVIKEVSLKERYLKLQLIFRRRKRGGEYQSRINIVNKGVINFGLTILIKSEISTIKKKREKY